MSDCARCGHAERAGKCAGDPLDVPNSGIGGSEPHVPQGCLCGDPEFVEGAYEDVAPRHGWGVKRAESVRGDYEAPGKWRPLFDADKAAAAIAEARATLAEVAAMRERGA